MRKLLVALACASVFAGAGAVYALAGHEAEVASYTGCLGLSSGKFSGFAAGESPSAPCNPGEVMVHLSGGDISDVQTPVAGGLEGGNDNGVASLALQESYKLPQACAAGQVPKWSGPAWLCGTDANSTYTAGTGLQLTGSEFSITQGFRLPQCAAGQVAKAAVGFWNCAADNDSGGDVTGVTAGTGLTGGGSTGTVTLGLGSGYQLPQGCSAGQVAKKNSFSDGWVCAPDSDSPDPELLVFQNAGAEVTLCGVLDVTCSSVGTASASCPAGSSATGGGYFVRTGEIEIDEFGPSNIPPTTWRISAHNNQAFVGAHIRAYVMCARLS
jgi:hypothetical protein